MHRRTFLRLGLGAAAWPAALAAEEPARRPRSVIWLWMGGGPGQADTWDPKPGGTPAIETAVPGIRISELLPRCAAQAGRLAIVRSMTTEVDTPERATEMMHTGRRPYPRPAFASIGTILAYESGKKGLGVPKHVLLDGPDVPTVRTFADEDLPYQVRDSDRWSQVPEDLARLLADLNGDRLRPAADRLLASPLLKAFDARGEAEALRKDYGGAFGQKCLLARRLVEAGCPFVEVGLNGWEDGERVKALSGDLDAGMATLVRDLAERDFLKDTVVVWCGPFGRSRDGKRGPWTRGFSAVLAGGPIQGGRVYGDTGPEGKDCAKPVHPALFHATIYKACGIDRGKYVADGHTWTYVKDWPKPIAELF